MSHEHEEGLGVTVPAPVMQETTRTDVNSPKSSNSVQLGSRRQTGKENPVPEADWQGKSSSKGGTALARTATGSTGHHKRTGTPANRRDGQATSARAPVNPAATPSRSTSVRKEKLGPTPPAIGAKNARFMTPRRLEHKISLLDEESEPTSPRTSVGSVRSFADDDTRGLVRDESGMDNIKVIIRIRPRSASEREEAERDMASGVSSLNHLSMSSLSVATPGHEPHTYSFDHIADELTSQEDMFCLVGAPVIENVLAGFNSSIFAYGQTGSGKTYTTLGQPRDLDKRGLAPRMFERLFNRISEEEDRSGRDVRYSCRCSFLEIYNESISDLLNPAAVNLQLREDVKRGCFVDGLSDHIVLNHEDAMTLIVRGAENRRVSETRMNRESSRSHSVFTCTIESTTRNASGVTNVRFSRLNIIDLAGSERNKTSGATGEHFKEACLINRSLTTLGRVIMELVEAQRMQRRASHVPYRDSRLTFLLQDSLGGNAKTVVIANVSPAPSSAFETHSTLQFASRAKYIRNKAVVNEDTQGDMELLRREILRLNRELEIVHSESREPLLRENQLLRTELDAAHASARETGEQLALALADLHAARTEIRWAEPRLSQMETEKDALTAQSNAIAADLHRLEGALCRGPTSTTWETMDGPARRHRVDDLAEILREERGQHQEAQELADELQSRLAYVEAELEAAGEHATAQERTAAAREAALQQEVEALQCQLVSSRQANERLEAKLVNAHGTAQRIAGEADALRVEVGEALKAEKAAAAEAHAAQARALAASQEAAEEARRLVEAADAAHASELARLAKELDEARAECTESRVEVRRLAGEVGTLSGQLSACRAEASAAQATASHVSAEHSAQVAALEQSVSKAQVAAAQRKAGEDAAQEEVRRLKREARDAAVRAEAQERYNTAEVTELKRALEEAQGTLEGIRQDAVHEASRSAKYKRALADIDDLILWARTSPSASRARSGASASFRCPRLPSGANRSPSRPPSAGSVLGPASGEVPDPSSRGRGSFPLTVRVDNPAYLSPTAAHSPAVSGVGNPFAN